MFTRFSTPPARPGRATRGDGHVWIRPLRDRSLPSAHQACEQPACAVFSKLEPTSSPTSRASPGYQEIPRVFLIPGGLELL